MEISTCGKEICRLGNEFFARKRELFPRSDEFFPQLGGGSAQEKSAIKKHSFSLKHAYYFIAAALVVTFVNVNADRGHSGASAIETIIFVPEMMETTVVEPEKYDLEDILDLRKYYVEWDSYVIERGDTLWDIAERYTGNGLAYHAIVEKNRMSNPDLIFPGERITIPILYSIQ